MQLLKLLEGHERPSLIDYGCGYGALARFVIEHGMDFAYTGFDAADEMIDAARSLIRDPRCTFTSRERDLEQADYTLASGIFNVKLTIDEIDWQRYVRLTLDALAGRSRKGFAFNMLTRFANGELMRDDLYYADPMHYFALCKERYSRHVALLHDYELHEFTVLVRLGADPKPLAG